MKHESMDASQKVAIVLLSLDQGLAAELLGRMPRDMVERVTLAIANTGDVTRDQQESVLYEFKSAFLSRPLMQPTGPETARELLERTLDQSEVEPIQQRFEEQVFAGPFAFLHTRHADDIRLLIEIEHPQTIALIVAQLPPGLSARVLAGFESVRQAEIIGRLAVIGPTDAETLTEIATLLQNRIGKRPVRTGGIVHVAEVLREAERTTTASVMKQIDQKDPHLADSIRNSLFSFQDLSSLDEDILAIVLQETSDCPWAVALKGCSEKLSQRIFRLLPSDIGKGLKREMSSAGPLRLSEISSAQQEIAKAILALEVDGRIELPATISKKQKPADRFKHAN